MQDIPHCCGSKIPAVTLQDNTGRLLKQMAAGADDLDALFDQLDTSLAESKHVFSQIGSSSPAPAVDAAVGSNAAWLASGSSHTGAAAAHDAASALQVPAYVHVGDPLIVDEPCPDSSVSTMEVQDIDW